jgi:hypothetical protein
LEVEAKLVFSQQVEDEIAALTTLKEHAKSGRIDANSDITAVIFVVFSHKIGSFLIVSIFLKIICA